MAGPVRNAERRLGMLRLELFECGRNLPQLQESVRRVQKRISELPEIIRVAEGHLQRAKDAERVVIRERTTSRAIRDTKAGIARLQEQLRQLQ